jgi:hypothetical protein
VVIVLGSGIEGLRLVEKVITAVTVGITNKSLGTMKGNYL